jgi:hypothetical protein
MPCNINDAARLCLHITVLHTVSAWFLASYFEKRNSTSWLVVQGPVCVRLIQGNALKRSRDQEYSESQVMYARNVCCCVCYYSESVLQSITPHWRRVLWDLRECSASVIDCRTYRRYNCRVPQVSCTQPSMNNAYIYHMSARLANLSYKC